MLPFPSTRCFCAAVSFFIMRARALSAILVLVAFSASADDTLGPVEYLKIISDSKLRYNILGEPSKSPATGMDCPRRDLSTRVITKGKDKSLEAWIATPEALKLLEEGEALYDAEKMSEAGEKYAAAIEADPQAASAYFFYGDTLMFGANESQRALEQYQKGIALDPTMPSGHLFASTALVRLGRLDEAREQIIQALVYYPGYEGVWKIADAQPRHWNARVTRFKFEPPAGYLGGDEKKGIDLYFGEAFEWGGYAMCKAAWAHEKRFAKKHMKDGWSVEEERACLLNQLFSQYNSTEAKLVEEKKKGGVANPVVTEAEIISALPPLERHLFDVAESHLIDGYVLFEIIGQHCPLSLSIMADDALQQIEGYVRKYVVVKAE